MSAARRATRRTSEQRPFPQAGPSFQGHPSTYVSRSGVHEHPSFPWFPLIDFPTPAHGLPSQSLSAASRIPQENLRFARSRCPGGRSRQTRPDSVSIGLTGFFAELRSPRHRGNLPSVVPGQSPVQAGQVSPDGMWRWDGRVWTPIPPAGGQIRAQGPALPVRRIVLLALVSAGGVLAIIIALASQIQIGASTCLPPDFPTYPGASTSSEFAFKGNPPDCVMVLHTNASQLTAVQFYESVLNTGDWKVASVSATTGTMTFNRRSRPQTAGTISFVGHTNGTNMYVHVKGG